MRCGETFCTAPQAGVLVLRPVYESVREYGKYKSVYYDGGKETDILDIAKKYDVDTVRIRLWNDPWSESGESYGAGGNDLAMSLAIAKKITEAGFGVLLHFHYSDFWADPGKQIKPKAWADYDAEELERVVYDFTLAAMRAFLANGINITMVQVGNELSNGLLWTEGRTPNYDNIAKFVNAGIRAVRAADGEYQSRVAQGKAQPLIVRGEKLTKIPVMLHLDNGGNNGAENMAVDPGFLTRCRAGLKSPA